MGAIPLSEPKTGFSRGLPLRFLNWTFPMRLTCSLKSCNPLIFQRNHSSCLWEIPWYCQSEAIWISRAVEESQHRLPRKTDPHTPSRISFGNWPVSGFFDSVCAHISQIFQVSDGLLSDSLKSAKKYSRSEGEPLSQVEQNIRSFHPNEIATTSTTMKRCWWKANRVKEWYIRESNWRQNMANNLKQIPHSFRENKWLNEWSSCKIDAELLGTQIAGSEISRWTAWAVRIVHQRVIVVDSSRCMNSRI
jgi:hypothetical protein